MINRLIVCCLVLSVFVGDLAYADDVEITPDVVYGHKFGMAMTYDVFQPEDDANGAAVIFVVSGGWYSRWSPPANLLRFSEPLTKKGFTVFTLRHGSSPKYSIPEIVADVRRGVRHIRMHAEKYNIDSDRLGVYGMSAGGHLSLMLGTASDEGNPEAKDPVQQVSDHVNAVVAWVPPTDLRIMVWEAPDHLPAYEKFPALDLSVETAAEYSPLLHVSEDDPPTLVISGAKDKLVPIVHSELIQKAFEEKGVTSELAVYENAAHGFGKEDREDATAKMVDWFEKHLAEK